MNWPIGNRLIGTGQLARLIVRRDRLVMPLWILVIALVPISYAATFDTIYPTAAARALFAETSGSTAGFIALYGRLYGSSLGELVTWRAGFVPIVIGLISILTVIRHTRSEEDAGRRELIGSAVVGRNASLVAALSATVGANIVLGSLLAAAMTSQHLPASGSIAVGAQFASAGVLFGAVAGVTAQLTSSSGSARGIAVIVLGVAYLLRVVGDVSSQSGGTFAWVSWLSPIYWVQQIHPYGGNRWWPVALTLAAAMVFCMLALVLSERRDVGAGLFAPRLGPAEAKPSLSTPLALAWRLHRNLLAGWIFGFAALGVVLGGLSESVADLLEGNPNLQQILARLGGQAGLVDVYLASVMSILGLIACAYGIQATLRLRTEESSGRVEQLLSTGVGRFRWAMSHLVFSALGPAAALATAGVTAGLTHGINTDDVGQALLQILGAALVQLPAVWVLTAITVALVGRIPKIAAAGWGALAACLLISLVGTALQLDHWILDLSPFTHIPKLPGSSLSLAPLIALTAIAFVLATIGIAALRRRDIPVG